MGYIHQRYSVQVLNVKGERLLIWTLNISIYLPTKCVYVDMGCGMHEWDSPWLKKWVDKPIWETYHWKMMVFCSVFLFSSSIQCEEKMFLKVIKMDWVQTCLGLARTHFEFLGFCPTWFLKSIVPHSLSLSLSLSRSFFQNE